MPRSPFNLYCVYPSFALISSNHHLREHLLRVSGPKATAALLNLTRSGLLTQDLVEAKKQLFQSGGADCIATELALQTLRRDGDYDALLNYYHSQQMLDEMLLLMAKHIKDLEGELHLWLLNVIKLATILYDEDNDLDHLYRTYHFMKHYCPVCHLGCLLPIGGPERCSVSKSFGGLIRVC